MCDTSRVTVGTIVVVKIGRNEIEAVVTEVGDSRWKVKKVGGDREFLVTRIERVVGPEAEPEAPEPEAAPATEPGETEIPPEAETETAGQETEPEAAAEPASEPVEPAPEKKLSLLNAALRILEQSETPLNTREIIARVVASGLWNPGNARTPEQSLYSVLFREIRDKETPRVRKSSGRRGAFEINR